MSMQKFWDEMAQRGDWAAHYDAGEGLRTYNFVTRRAAVVKLLEDEGRLERILDVGCGTGDYVEVADAHDGRFFGIDYAPEMIRQAAQRFPGHNRRHLFAVASGEHVPYADDTFDLVVAMGYIEYFADPAVPLREIRRVLKPGGILVMQSFKWNLFSNLRRWVWKPLREAVRGRRDERLPPSWVNNKYGRRQLDDLVAPFGFRPEGGVYNNFHVLPARLRPRFPRLYMRMSEAIGRAAPTAFGFLAANWVGRYRLQPAAAEGGAAPAVAAGSTA